MIKLFFVLATLSISNANAASPPWYYYWNLVKATVGSDPCFTVGELKFPSDGNFSAQNPILVPVKGCTLKKAQLLAVFLKDNAELDYVATEVSFNSTIIHERSAAWTLTELKKNFSTAFATNPYFVKVGEAAFGPTPIFKPEVIQFFCDNIAVPSAYCSFVAADAFTSVLKDNVSGFNLIMATDLKHN